jgi:hypothetical protein
MAEAERVGSIGRSEGIYFTRVEDKNKQPQRIGGL